MNRRGFLKLAGGAIACAVVQPKVLFEPIPEAEIIAEQMLAPEGMVWLSGNGIWGIPYYYTPSNAGAYLGLERGSYGGIPRKISSELAKLTQ